MQNALGGAIFKYVLKELRNYFASFTSLGWRHFLCNRANLRDRKADWE